jgi:hypothetical protein
LSVVVLRESSFSGCNSLESVMFENGSKLEQIKESVFSESGLRSIQIPSSVVLLGKSIFLRCTSLEAVVFERDSQLARIEESAFFGSGLRSIQISSSVILLDKSSFSWCNSLETVIFERNLHLKRIEDFAFRTSDLKSIVIPSLIEYISPFSLPETCHQHWCDSRSQYFVNCQKLPHLAVEVIRAEFRRHDPHISLGDLDRVIFWLSEVSTK